ncbi:MAG: HAMP domain-containing protein, partial [Vicinamibacteria bacterium]
METDRVRQERRSRGRFWGIRAKVFALVILSALLPTVLVGTSSYWTARNALTDKLSEQLNSKASLAAAQIFEWVQERSHDARVFASSGIVVSNVERQSLRSGRGESLLREYLEHVLGRSGIYSSLLVLDDRGALLSFAGSANEKDLVSRLESSSRSGSFFEFGPEGTRLWLQTPILGGEGKTVGWLVLGCRLDTLHDALAAESATDRMRLTSSDNRLILAYPRESVSTETLPEVVPEEGTIADYRDPRGVRVLAAARTVEGGDLEKPMLLVVATDWDVALTAVTDLGRRIVLLSALAAVLVIALAYGLVVSLTGPLEKLTAGAHALSRGDYSIQIPVETGDEIGYLTQVFNRMTSALKKSHESLQELSVTDELTKLCNRRQFRKALAEELGRGEKTGIGFSIIMIDIDHFK